VSRDVFVDRSCELWVVGSSSDVASDVNFVGLIVRSSVSEGRFFGENAGQVVHSVLDLTSASGGDRSVYYVEERVLSDPLSGWRRLA